MSLLITQVDANLLKQSEIDECKNVFIASFTALYKDKITVIGLQSQEELVNWLVSAFDTWFYKAKEGSNVQLLLAKEEDKISALAFTEEHDDYVYLAQMAISPSSRITSQLMLHITDAYTNKPIRFVLRKINTEARLACMSLCAKPSTFMYPGYDAEVYQGYEM